MSLKTIIWCYLLQSIVFAATMNLEQPGKFENICWPIISYQLFYLSIKFFSSFLVISIEPRANITGKFKHWRPIGYEFPKPNPLIIISRFFEHIKNFAFNCWRDQCSIWRLCNISSVITSEWWTSLWRFYNRKELDIDGCSLHIRVY